MNKYSVLQPVTGIHGIHAVGGKGIELYDEQGKTYLDLSEISTVLGQKNEHFNKRITEKLSGLVGGKIARSPERESFYNYLSETHDRCYSERMVSNLYAVQHLYS
jgi:4-aminobutyrate aminotransferase-like enzyme